jgi:hypothetical protein
MSLSAPCLSERMWVEILSEPLIINLPKFYFQSFFKTKQFR